MARKPEPPAAPLTPTQTWWLLAAGLAAYAPLVPQVPLWLALAAGVVFVWRTALAWWRQPLPARWLLAFVSLAGIAGILLEYRTLFGQKAGVALLLLFLGLKQLEARAPRDGLAIILLAYFLTLTQFFENQSIAVAATMLLTLVTSTAALANLTDAQGNPRALVRLAGLMLIQALPFMLVLFILFPRVSGPLWGLPTDAYSTMTGLSESMSPGAINNLIQSDAIAFRVKFDGPVPPKKDLYWRGPVLSRLEGRTWLPGTPRLSESLTYETKPETPLYSYTITQEPHNKPWLFALEFPLALPPDSIATSDFQILAKKPVRQRLRHELRSRTAIGTFNESRRVLYEAVQLPRSLNPRTQALAAQLSAPGGGDQQVLLRAIDFMLQQQLTYTLQPPLMGQHVADEFLFDHKHGFCEHFAAAFVVLLRASGVPARVVTGYQGGEHNPVDDTWVIRQSDAHAWAEVWIERRGWVRVDPTAASAPARIEENLAAAVPAGDPLPFLSGEGLAWLRDMRYRWWAVSNSWNQWILGYNPERQREFLLSLGMRDPDWRAMTAWLTTLCGLLLLALLGLMLYHRPRLDPAERAWRTVCRRLARRGLARNDWEGPRDFAARVAQAFPQAANEFGRISRLYANLRYGTIPINRQQAMRGELHRRIAAFKP